MSTKRIDIILSIIVCLYWTLMIPFFYFYLFGMIGAFLIPPYILVGFVLSILWFIRFLRMIRRKDKYLISLVLIQILPVITIPFLLSGDKMEKFDWNYNYSARMNLINMIETGKIKVPINGKVKSWHFPPISNGGNEIIVYQDSITKKITATFYIDRGFIDHYSAFIYSSIPEEIKWFDDRYIKTKEPNNKRINKNWFRISE